MKKIIALLSSMASLGGAIAQAQTVGPAQMGITATTPQSLQVLDSSKIWVPFVTVDPATHLPTFISPLNVANPAGNATLSVISGANTAYVAEDIAGNAHFENQRDGGVTLVQADGAAGSVVLMVNGVGILYGVPTGVNVVGGVGVAGAIAAQFLSIQPPSGAASVNLVSGANAAYVAEDTLGNAHFENQRDGGITVVQADGASGLVNLDVNGVDLVGVTSSAINLRAATTTAQFLSIQPPSGSAQVNFVSGANTAYVAEDTLGNAHFENQRDGGITVVQADGASSLVNLDVNGVDLLSVTSSATTIREKLWIQPSSGGGTLSFFSGANSSYVGEDTLGNAHFENQRDGGITLVQADGASGLVNLQVNGVSMFYVQSTGVTVGGGITASALPAAAGGGGLAVCVDSAGVFYKKAACP